jgi:hypothetical protein
MRQLGQRGILNKLMSGTGYIFIPNDITDREKFISDCYNTSTVSILNTEGQRFDRVQVNRSMFYDLDFPETVDDIGSLVFWVKNQKHNQPVVVAVINKRGEVLGFQKGQFSIRKDSSTGNVSITGDSNKGNLFINVQSDEGGNIVINAKNTNKSNKVQLNIDGNIETVSSNFNSQVLEQFLVKIKNSLESDGETTIKYVRETGFEYSDEFGNILTINDDGFKYVNGDNVFEMDSDGKVSIKNGNYSLTDLITDLIQLLEAAKVSTSIGLQPFVNLSSFTSLRTTDLPKILK